MRVLSFTWKPISSPGRTDKFPPPLMRFLRTKSKAKNRSKYPLFLRRNKKAITASSSSSPPPFAIEPTQEPSSPKVTCIGQVRVRRSKSKPKPKPASSSGQKPSSCCCCFGKPIRFFSCFFKTCKPDCKKWVFFFCNCRRSVRVRTDSSKFGSSRFEQENDEIRGGGAREEVRQKWRSMGYCMEEEVTPPSTVTPPASTVTPPKNALLLTRCRSAPYRSSSLACQFWGSPPLKNTEEEDEEEERNDSALGMERSRDSSASSRRDQDSQSSGRTTTSNNNNNNNNSQKDDLGVCARVDYCLNQEIKNGEIEEDSVVIAKPMVLMRSKSEPTRRDLDKFDPQSSEFWRQRRLSNTQS